MLSDGSNTVGICFSVGYQKTLYLMRSLRKCLIYGTGALAWNADLLASGSRDRMIMLHDTRIMPVVPEKRLAGHRQEVSNMSLVCLHFDLVELKVHANLLDYCDS